MHRTHPWAIGSATASLWSGLGRCWTRLARKPGLSLAFGALLALAGAAAAGGPSTTNADTVTVSRAAYLASPAPSPPLDARTGWRPVELPFSTLVARGRPAPHGWFRVRLQLEREPQGVWAMYLPGFYGNAALYLGSRLLDRRGRLGEGRSVNWNRPLLHTVPAELLGRGVNTFYIRTAGYAGRLHLPPVTFGPQPVLEPIYRGDLLQAVTIPRLATGLATVIGALMAILWLHRRRETLYLFFASATLAWAFQNINYFIHQRPLPDEIWDCLIPAARAWFVILLAFFIHRYAGLRRPRLERVLAATGAAVFVLLVLLPLELKGWFVANYLHTGLLALAVYLLGVVIWTTLERRRGGDGLLLAVSLLVVGFGVWDWLAVLGHIPAGNLRLLPYGAPALFAAVGWLLVDRFVQALRDSERLGRQLETRVAEKHRELETNYQSLKRLERERALAHERERIMHEMHDGLGGQLVATLSMVEMGRYRASDIAAALRTGLEDLRIMVDSLDPGARDLITALGMVRARLAGRLEAAGIAMQWRVRDLPQPPELGPRGSLQVMRIVQEALSNAVKHAGAGRVTVSTDVSDDARPWILVCVADNGAGMSATAGSGHGLRNMHRRAAALGGKLQVRTGPDGTTVTLYLPGTACRSEPAA